MKKFFSNIVIAILSWMVSDDVREGTKVCRSGVNLAVLSQIGLWFSAWKLSMTTGFYHTYVGWGMAVGHVLVWVGVFIAVVAYPVFGYFDRVAAKKAAVAKAEQDARVAAYRAREAVKAAEQAAKVAALKAEREAAEAHRPTKAEAAAKAYHAAKASVTVEELDRVVAAVARGGLTEYGAATTLQRSHGGLSTYTALEMVRERVSAR